MSRGPVPRRARAVGPVSAVASSWTPSALRSAPGTLAEFGAALWVRGRRRPWTRRRGGPERDHRRGVPRSLGSGARATFSAISATWVRLSLSLRLVLEAARGPERVPHLARPGAGRADLRGGPRPRLDVGVPWAIRAPAAPGSGGASSPQPRRDAAPRALLAFRVPVAAAHGTSRGRAVGAWGGAAPGSLAASGRRATLWLRPRHAGLVVGATSPAGPILDHLAGGEGRWRAIGTDLGRGGIAPLRVVPQGEVLGSSFANSADLSAQACQRAGWRPAAARAAARYGEGTVEEWVSRAGRASPSAPAARRAAPTEPRRVTATLRDESLAREVAALRAAVERPAPPTSPPPLDLEALTARVWDGIERRARVERQRRGP